MIAFGCPITLPDEYERWAGPSIRRCAEPDSVVLEQTGHGSIQDGLNAILDTAAGYADLEAVVLLHQDVELNDPGILGTIRRVFSDPAIGILGTAGARGVLGMNWAAGDHAAGRVDWPGLQPFASVIELSEGAQEVDALDGVVIVASPAVARSVRFNPNLGSQFHGYDIDYCLQVRARGWKVVVDDLHVSHHVTAGYRDRDRWIRGTIAFQSRWDRDLWPREWEPDALPGDAAAMAPWAGVAPELVAEIQREPAWMYPWQLGGGRTTPVHEDAGVGHLPAIHQTRKHMIEPYVRTALARPDGPSRAIDLGCNEGWFSHALLEWGADSVLGVDGRELNVRRGGLIRDHLGVPAARLELRAADVFALDTEELGQFDVVLLLGLLYHVEDAMGLLRRARALTGSVCLIETQVLRPATATWVGLAGEHVAEEAVVAMHAEGDSATNPLASLEGNLSVIPSIAALERMCRAAGFGATELIDPAPGAHHWYRDRDRVVVAATR